MLRQNREKMFLIKFFMHAAAYLNGFECPSCEITHKRPGSEFGAINKRGRMKKGNKWIFILPLHLFLPFSLLVISNVMHFYVSFVRRSFGALHCEASCNRHLTLNNRLSFYANELLLCIVVIVPFDTTQNEEKSWRNETEILSLFLRNFNFWLSQIFSMTILEDHAWSLQRDWMKAFWIYFGYLSIMPWLNL